MSGERKNRRSFVVDLMSSAAGVWVAVTGGVTLSALAASGCSDDTAAKYGGMPKYGGNPADQAVVKYGGFDMRADGSNPDVKYGGHPDQAVAKPDTGPMVKYGGKPDTGPMVKYGGVKMDKGAPKPDIGPMVKYGGVKKDAGGADGPFVKYGGTPKYGGNPA